MVKSKIVKEWFKYAIRDLKTAQHTMHLGSDYKNQVAFHIQQCLEKAVKGFLAHKKVRFTKTHSIKALADEVARVDMALAQELAKYEKMSRYAVIFRYPDSEEKPLTMREVTSSLKAVQRIYDHILDKVEKS